MSISLHIIVLGFWETTLQWLAVNYPGICQVTLLAFAVGYITWHFARLYHRFERVEDQGDDLRNRYIPDIYSKFSSVDKKLDNVIISLNNINTFLTTTASDKFTPIFVSRSPIGLTAFGEKVLLNTGGKKYVDDNRIALIEDILAKGFKSALDVQNYTYTLLLEKLRGDSLVEIRNFVYQYPVYKDDEGEIPLNLTLLAHIMGVYLRDRYLEEYPVGG